MSTEKTDLTQWVNLTDLKKQSVLELIVVAIIIVIVATIGPLLLFPHSFHGEKFLASHSWTWIGAIMLIAVLFYVRKVVVTINKRSQARKQFDLLNQAFINGQKIIVMAWAPLSMEWLVRRIYFVINNKTTTLGLDGYINVLNGDPHRSCYDEISRVALFNPIVHDNILIEQKASLQEVGASVGVLDYFLKSQNS